MLYDVSTRIYPRMTVWPGSPPVQLELLSSLDAGDASNDSVLRMGVHAGTHVDAPLHFIPGGRSIDEVRLDILIGPCMVADTGEVECIAASDLEGIELPSGTRRLLLKTRNSRVESGGFDPDFVALAPDAARWLVESEIRLVGIDTFSIQRFHDPTPETHQFLLRHEIVILEGLRLHGIPAGAYELFCLPLRLVGAEAAPARVVLRTLE